MKKNLKLCRQHQISQKDAAFGSLTRCHALTVCRPDPRGTPPPSIFPSKPPTVLRLATKQVIGARQAACYCQPVIDLTYTSADMQSSQCKQSPASAPAACFAYVLQVVSRTDAIAQVDMQFPFQRPSLAPGPRQRRVPALAEIRTPLMPEMLPMRSPTPAQVRMNAGLMLNVMPRKPPMSRQTPVC